MNTIKLKKLWNRMCDSLKVEINEDNSIIRGFENNISHVKNVMKASDFIWYKKAVKNHEKRQLDFRNTLARQAREEDTKAELTDTQKAEIVNTDSIHKGRTMYSKKN